MSEPIWCTCKGHHAKDFSKLTDYYCRHFIPGAWELEYITLDFKETGRRLHLNGKCDQCGGFMRCGVPLPANLTGEDLLSHIFRSLCRYRPFDRKDASGVYHGACPKRSDWFWEQDRLSAQECKKQFISLFRAEDQSDAQHWTEKYIPTPLIHRDTAAELFHAVVQRVKDEGLWPEQSTFFTLTPSGPQSPSPVLTDYRFSLWPELNFGGQEGLYIDCVLYGTFDKSGRDHLHIGAIHTTATDRDTCLVMGGLSGALLYYAKAYLDANIHRYTPDAELEAQAEMNQGKGD